MSELATALRAEVDRASREFRRWSEADATRDRGAGKWVPKQVLGHLIDSAANNHQRFVRAQLASPFSGPGYDQVAWVALHRYRERPWLELVDLWVALNRHVAAVIEDVPTEKLATPCTVGDGETRPLEWWMQDYLRHLKHHLEQLGRA
ncbi:MAG: DinB family protein [Candidatus Methylomirabilales bacterium]